MAIKAVQITTLNKNYLTERFGSEVNRPLLSIGYYLVTDFGNEDYFDVVSPAIFNETFEKVSKLRNGFYDVVRRDSEG